MPTLPEGRPTRRPQTADPGDAMVAYAEHKHTPTQAWGDLDERGEESPWHRA